MSSNGSKKRYDSIYLKKSSYNTFSGGTIIKKYKVKEGEKKGKIAIVYMKKDSNGDTKYKICYKKGGI